MCEQVQMRQEQDDVAFRVLARGEGAHAAQDGAALHDYFNLGTSLAKLSLQWAQGDGRFRNICPYYPGTLISPCQLLAPWALRSRSRHGQTCRHCCRYSIRLDTHANTRSFWRSSLVKGVHRVALVLKGVLNLECKF